MWRFNSSQGDVNTEKKLHTTADLHEKDFPFVVNFYDDDTGERLRSIAVDGPGLMDVPGFPGRKIRVEIVWPNEVMTAGPDGEVVTRAA